MKLFCHITCLRHKNFVGIWDTLMAFMEMRKIKRNPGVLLLVLHQSENQQEIEICTETQVLQFDARKEEINRNVHRNSSRAVMMQLQK